MTNINPQSELALARAAVPAVQWGISVGGSVRSTLTGMPFAPTNLDFTAVLCWLLSQGALINECAVRVYPLPASMCVPEVFPHDNTPASLAAAVHRAAIRFIEARTER